MKLKKIFRDKKPAMIAFVVVTVIFEGLFFFMSHYYVYVLNQFYEIDSSYIEVDFFSEKNHLRTLSNFDHFTNLEEIRFSFVSNTDDLNDMSDLNTVKSFSIACSDIGDASFLERLHGLEKIHLVETFIDCNQFSIDTLSSMDFITCNIQNIDSLKKMNSLTELKLFQCDFSGVEIVSDKYILQDSSAFSELHSVKKLMIGKTVIEEISGFLNMKSLETICIDQYCITDEQIDRLMSAGIQVELQEREIEGSY